MHRILWITLTAAFTAGLAGCAGSMDKPPKCSGPYYQLNTVDHYPQPTGKDAAR